MAIISFWSGDKKESAQTLSMVAVATHMAIEHNYRILIVDATFSDDTLERCFWKISNKKKNGNPLMKGKVDIASGAEGLVSAVASNKATPEIIPNFTKVILKNRLDVVCGLKTDVVEDYEKSLIMYKDLLFAANKYYDLVFVDLSKTLKNDTVKTLLENSHIIIYTFSQNLRQVDTYIENISTQKILQKGNVIPLLTNSDDNSKYNVKNASRYIGEKKEIATIPYNSNYMECTCEAGVANFFLRTRLSTSTQDKNSDFIKSVDDTCKKIIYKLEELKYKT
jgi:hypothetical protein